MTPTPEPVVGTVTNTGGLALNCRTQPNTTSEIITILQPEMDVEVIGEEEDGWIPVICDDQDGWVSADFLTLEGEASPEPPTVTVVTNGPQAACRLEANTISLIIARVESGTEVVIRGETTDDGWVPVTCGGLEGWIFEDLIESQPGD